MKDQEIIIKGMEESMAMEISCAKDEAWRSIDSGNPEDARMYSISAQKHMVIAKTWESAIRLIRGFKP
jgi:hypothetical protein